MTRIYLLKMKSSLLKVNIAIISLNAKKAFTKTYYTLNLFSDMLTGFMLHVSHVLTKIHTISNY